MYNSQCDCFTGAVVYGSQCDCFIDYFSILLRSHGVMIKHETNFFQLIE